MTVSAKKLLAASAGQGDTPVVESTKVVIHDYANAPYIYVYDIDQSTGISSTPRSPSTSDDPSGSTFGGIGMRGDYICQTGIQGTPNTEAYKDTGSGNLTRLSGSTGLQSLVTNNGLGGGVGFAPNADYLLVNAGGSDILSYSRTGDVFTSVGASGITVSGSPISLHWSKSGSHVIVTGTGTPALYSHDGDGTFTAVTSSFSGAPGNAAGFVSNNGEYVGIGNASLQIYSISGGTATAMATSGVTVSGIRGGAFHPDGTHCVIYGDGAPYAQILELVGSTWTAISSPFSTAPSAACQGGDWSNAGGMIVLATNSSPFILGYSWDGSSATKFSDPSTTPVGLPSRESIAFN